MYSYVRGACDHDTIIVGPLRVIRILAHGLGVHGRSVIYCAIVLQQGVRGHPIEHFLRIKRVRFVSRVHC
jgi:hypothetical protein